eukprot:m.529700 g.529700  ORF g.529700 m.529700 type:complete len:409 (-) comp22019_c1_seq4:438-1664(-)
MLKNVDNMHFATRQFHVVFTLSVCVVAIRGINVQRTTAGLPKIDFMRSAAVAELPIFDCNGTCSKYRINASTPPSDALEQLASPGKLNTVRLRLFAFPYPNNTYAGLSSVLRMAKRAQHAGLAITLDIFYTQWFFGPDGTYLERRTPVQWKNLTFPALVDTMHAYTFNAIHALVAQGTPPQSVQIGNEIDCGLFHNWHDQPCSAGGEVCQCKDNWQNLADLIKAGYNGIKAAYPSAVVIIQLGASKDLAYGGEYIEKFYTSIANHGALFDAFGLSFYQIWGAQNVSNICAIAGAARALPEKLIYVIETGYPYKDGGNAPQDMKPKPQYGISPQAQIQWLQAVIYTVQHGLWGRGAGVSWWGTEYAFCSHDECAGFWDNEYNALPILTKGAFRPTGTRVPPGSVVCPPL